MAGRLDVRGGLERVVEAVSRLSLLPSPIERITSPPDGAPTARPAPAGTSITITTSATTSTSRGSTTRWSTPAPISSIPTSRSRTRSAPSSTWSAGSCGCSRARRWSRRDAAGGRWRCTWPAPTASASRRSTSRASRSRTRANGPRAKGSPSQVEFIDDDYRNVTGEYDAFVSVGMLEHVGLKHFGSLAEVLSRVLRRAARPRAAALHRPRHSASAERVGGAPHLPRRLSADARGSGDQGPRAGADVDRRRREPAAALRAHARALGHSDSPRSKSRCARGTARRSGAPGSCTWRGPKPPSPSAACSSFRSSSRRWRRRRRTGHARRCTAGRRRIRAATAVMIRCDALIVGGGPAGSTCARVLRQAGWRVIVIDRARFPRDKVCAGWVTPGVFQLLDLDPPSIARPD